MNQTSYLEFNIKLLYLTDHNDLRSFESIRASGVEVIDKIRVQLEELIRIENPDENLSDEKIDYLILEKLGKLKWSEFGCWVYYPWRNVLFHTLDKPDFIKVRTARNLYKHTPEEQGVFLTKKIGIIGLSVGHSVAMAIAIERIADEIRIADFDHIELSNLNRIRTSILNIELPKTVVLAREIAEVDPFITLRIFSAGINENNINQFFDLNGKLDLLIEECDNVAVKVQSRVMAKQRGIPVIMDTSDRSLIDVERYDIDVEYPILHGLINDIGSFQSLNELKTTQEKLPYILPFAGISNISDRMALSAFEIESSISSWPQLGSEVQMGGALTAKYARNILLKTDELSCRIYADQKYVNIDSINLINSSDNQIQGTESIVSYCHPKYGVSINELLIKEILSESLRSPSASNLQPWTFLLCEGNYFLISSYSSEESKEDSNYIQIVLSLGCILENIYLLCATRNVNFYYSLINTEPTYPRIRLHFSQSVRTKEVSDLTKYIPDRNTDRSKVLGEVFTENDKRVLKQLFESEYSVNSLHTIIDGESINSLLDMIGLSDKIRLLDKKDHSFFYSEELIFQEYDHRESGLKLGDLHLDKPDEIGIQMLQREFVRFNLEKMDLGNNIPKISRSYKPFTNCISIITVQTTDVLGILESGRIIQRFWLLCTKLGFAVHPMTSAVPILYKHNVLNRYDSDYSQLKHVREVDTIFKTIVDTNECPVFICRLSKIENKRLMPSARYSIDQKLKRNEL